MPIADRDAEREHDRRRGHDGRPAGEIRRSAATGRRRADHADDAAGQRDDRRLDQELADDVALLARRWRGGRRSRASAPARWPA